MQKLVTIYLDNLAYMDGKILVSTKAKDHGTVEEHLASHLAEGWKVISVSGFGGAENPFVRGWLAVVLEKDES